MRLIDRFPFKWLRRRAAWQLLYDDTLMECRVRPAAGGQTEVEYFCRGELYHTFTHPTRQDAEAEVRRVRDDLMRAGWRELDHDRTIEATGS